MTRNATARAYARALFRTAQAQSQQDATAQSMRELGELWATSPEFRRFCHWHLSGNAENHVRTVRQIHHDALAPLVCVLLEKLAAWGHLALTPQIVAQYSEMDDRARKCVRVNATFAVAPTEETLRHVHELVAQTYGPGVLLDPKIDPALIAGFQLLLNGRRVDASMAGRLQRLRMGLRNPRRMKSRKHATPAH